MSVVYQADIFCDGMRVDDCVSFVEQGATEWNGTRGLAVGAWEVAKAHGWVRKVENGSFVHYCPKCQDAAK